MNVEEKYLARARHAQRVLDAFAGDVEEICKAYRMHPEVKDALRHAAKLARMSIRTPTASGPQARAESRLAGSGHAAAQPLPNPADEDPA